MAQTNMNCEEFFGPFLGVVCNYTQLSQIYFRNETTFRPFAMAQTKMNREVFVGPKAKLQPFIPSNLQLENVWLRNNHLDWKVKL